MGVSADVGDRGGILGQLPQVSQTTHLINQAVPVELFCQGHHVKRLITRGQTGQCAKNQAVVMAIEIHFAEQFDNPLPGRIFQHHPAQHCLLGFNRVRRNLQCRGLQVKFRSIGVVRLIHRYRPKTTTGRQK